MIYQMTNGKIYLFTDFLMTNWLTGWSKIFLDDPENDLKDLENDFNDL